MTCFLQEVLKWSILGVAFYFFSLAISTLSSKHLWQIKLSIMITEMQNNLFEFKWLVREELTPGISFFRVVW